MIKVNLSKFDTKIADVKIIHGSKRAGDIPHSLANIDKGKEILGYKPEYDIKNGLKEACEWYLGNLKK